MSGLAYSADDDCRELEREMQQSKSPSVYVVKHQLESSTVASEIGWDVLEEYLKKSGWIKPNETVYGFRATNKGLRVEFADTSPKNTINKVKHK